MNTHHRIDEMIFDITFDSMSSPHARESSLRSLIIEELLPVVDEVFTRYGGDDAVWRIDMLEIDIGNVPEQDFTAQIASRLRDSLERALHEKLAIAQRVTPPRGPERERVRLLSHREADEDVLKAYLTTGGMPWQVNAGSAVEHEALLGRLLQGGGDGLFAFLRGSPERDIALSRLAQQFPDSQLYEVLQHLTPVHFHRFRSLIEALRQVLDAASGGVFVQQRVTHLVWVSVFDAILDAPERIPDVTALIGDIVGRLATLRKTSYETTLAWLASALSPSQKEQGEQGQRREAGSASEVAAVLDTLNRRPGPGAAAIGIPSRTIRLGDMRDVQGRSVTAALATRDKAPLSLLFQEIRDGSQALTREAVGLPDLERMLLMFFESGMPAEVAKRASFMQAVSSHAQAAGDRHRFLAEVLIALAHERVVDLEAIVEISRAATEQAVSAAPAISLPMAPGGGENAMVDRERLRDRLAKALLSGEAAGIYEYWDIFASCHTALVREALRRYGMHDEVLARIALGFPESMLQDMIALLAPEAARATQPLWSQPALYEATGLEPHTSWAEWKRRLWKAGVRYLLRASSTAADASVFRTDDYIVALLPVIAGAAETRQRHLAAAWKKELADAGNAGTAEAAAGVAGQASVAVPAPAVIGEDEFSVAEITAILKSFENRYSNDRDVQETPTLPFGARKKEQERLQGYFQELRNGSAQLRASDWTTSSLESLVFAFVSLDARPAAADRALFIQAIASHALPAGNRHRYFAQVIAALIEDRVLDLEAIAAAARLADGGPEAGSHRIATAVSSSFSALAVPGTGDVPLQRLFNADFLAGQDPPLEWITWLIRMLRREPVSLRQALTVLLEDTRAGTRLLAVLPPSSWPHLLDAASPHAHRTKRCADDVADTFAFLHQEITAARVAQLTWEFLLARLFALDFSFAASHFAREFLDYLACRTNTQVTLQLAQLLHRRTGLVVASEAGGAILRKHPLPDTALPARAGTSPPLRAPADLPEKTKGGIQVINAGKVLAAPYLPRLWSMLDLTEAGAFKGHPEAERAVHLLQFMVNGSTSSPEYQLVLNKILCGVTADMPIARDIDITEKEADAIEQLLKAMIQHWKIIGNTSIAGLRESFLQRLGWLHMKDDAWHLRVQERTFDMLLDQLPWSFSIIKYPWMERAVHVKWR